MMAGNWKMNKTIDEASELAQAIRDQVADTETVDRVLCPPYVCLPAVSITVQGTSIAVGAQNMHWEESGAFTGEISAPMIVDLAQYVIIGHSERRQYFAETDETVNKKVHSAFAHGLTPIVCVGESLEQNEAGETHPFVSGQVTAALAGLSAEQVKSLIIAYEPIWAIGTGKTATADDAQEVCGAIRETLAQIFGKETADGIRVLYGGSAKPNNVAGFLEKEDVDGALVGGASLKADSFAAMVKAAM